MWIVSDHSAFDSTEQFALMKGITAYWDMAFNSSNIVHISWLHQLVSMAALIGQNSGIIELAVIFLIVMQTILDGKVDIIKSNVLCFVFALFCFS